MTDPDREGAMRRASTAGAWASRLSEVWDVGVLVLDSGGSPDFANARVRALLGVAHEDDLLARWTSLKALLADQLARATSGSDLPVEATVSLALHGGEVRLRVHVYVLEEDECVGHLLLVQHAGRAAAIEASLRHAAHDRGLASLYRDMAHDLKSVLNVLGLNLALLSRIAAEERGSPGQHELADRSGTIMRRELKRLDRSIALILDRNLLDRESPERFNLADCCERVAQLAASRAARQGVALEFQALEGSTVMVEGYADRIESAVLNLAVNALDAMPDGGRLEMRVWQEGRLSYLRVTDTGPGIAPEDLPNLWRLHSTTKPTGTGIGLYVTRTTIEAHGGSITHRAADGGSGAVFTIALPTAFTS